MFTQIPSYSCSMEPTVLVVMMLIASKLKSVLASIASTNQMYSLIKAIAQTGAYSMTYVGDFYAL